MLLTNTRNAMTIIKGFTPTSDHLCNTYDLHTAAVYGKMWRYIDAYGKCTASLQRLANELGINRRTVERKQILLKDGGYLEQIDNAPGVTKTWILTGKLGFRTVVEEYITHDRESYPLRQRVVGTHDRESYKDTNKESNRNNIKEAFTTEDELQPAQNIQEPEYVEDPFDEPSNKMGRPKWTVPKTPLEIKLIDACKGKRKYWKKGERPFKTKIISLERGLFPLDVTKDKQPLWPTEWVENVLEWFRDTNSKPDGYIPIKGFFTAINNTERKGRFIASYLKENQSKVPEAEDYAKGLEDSDYV